LVNLCAEGIRLTTLNPCEGGDRHYIASLAALECQTRAKRVVSGAAADRVMGVDVFMTCFLRSGLEAIKARRFQIGDQ